MQVLNLPSSYFRFSEMLTFISNIESDQSTRDVPFKLKFVDTIYYVFCGRYFTYMYHQMIMILFTL